MVQTYIKAVGGLSRAFAIIATVLLIAAMLVVCQMIFIRYVFRAATIWQTDFVVFSATGAMFLGAPYVLLKGGHVGVDVVEMIVSDKSRRAMRIVASLLGLVFCAIMFTASWLQFHETWTGNWRHASVWAPPLWIPISALPLGFGMLCLQYIAQILALVSGTAACAPAHGLGQIDQTATLVKKVAR
jgi:TRAP-type C4-dicarboxylate transport system permease small subunit